MTCSTEKQPKLLFSKSFASKILAKVKESPSRLTWPRHKSHVTASQESRDHVTRVSWPHHKSHVTTSQDSRDHIIRFTWPHHKSHVATSQESRGHITRVTWPHHKSHVTTSQGSRHRITLSLFLLHTFGNWSHRLSRQGITWPTSWPIKGKSRD